MTVTDPLTAPAPAVEPDIGGRGHDPRISDIDSVTESNDEVAHIGKRDEVCESYVTGEPIVALCGEVFIPTRDPSGMDVCEACKDSLALFYGLGPPSS